MFDVNCRSPCQRVMKFDSHTYLSTGCPDVVYDLRDIMLLAIALRFQPRKGISYFMRVMCYLDVPVLLEMV